MTNFSPEVLNPLVLLCGCLMYLSVSTRGVIGYFCGPYFIVRPAKLESLTSEI